MPEVRYNGRPAQCNPKGEKSCCTKRGQCSDDQKDCKTDCTTNENCKDNLASEQDDGEQIWREDERCGWDNTLEEGTGKPGIGGCDGADLDGCIKGTDILVVSQHYNPDPEVNVA